MKKSKIASLFVSAALIAGLPQIVEAKKSPSPAKSPQSVHVIRVSSRGHKNYYPNPEDDVRRYIHIGRGCSVDPSIVPSSIAVDVETGKVVAASRADSMERPASLTKLMTLYLTFEALKAGKIKLTDKLHVSAYAAQQERTNLSLKPNDQISVEDAIEGAAVQSANDAVMVLAEALGGSKDSFIKMMNDKAKELGMKQTKLLTPSGVPILDNVPMVAQVTDGRDMAVLGLSLQRDFPQYMHYLTEAKFTYPANDPKGITYINHNPLLGKDGIVAGKTGYECMSGWNLEAWANRGGKQYIVVVLGAHTKGQRVSMMLNVLNKLGPATPNDFSGNVFTNKVAPRILESAADIDAPVNSNYAPIRDAAVSPTPAVLTQASASNPPAQAAAEQPQTPEARIAAVHALFASRQQLSPGH